MSALPATQFDAQVTKTMEGFKRLFQEAQKGAELGVRAAEAAMQQSLTPESAQETAKDMTAALALIRAALAVIDGSLQSFQ